MCGRTECVRVEEFSVFFSFPVPHNQFFGQTDPTECGDVTVTVRVFVCACAHLAEDCILFPRRNPPPPLLIPPSVVGCQG